MKLLTINVVDNSKNLLPPQKKSPTSWHRHTALTTSISMIIWVLLLTFVVFWRQWWNEAMRNHLIACYVNVKTFLFVFIFSHSFSLSAFGVTNSSVLLHVLSLHEYETRREGNRMRGYLEVNTSGIFVCLSMWVCWDILIQMGNFRWQIYYLTQTLIPPHGQSISHKCMARNKHSLRDDLVRK